MGTPKKQKNGKWRGQIYLGRDRNGKSIIKTVTAETKAEWYMITGQLKYNGLPEEDKQMTVADAVRKYINSVEGIISPNTLRGYEVIQRNYFKGLMDAPVKTLDNLKVQTAINEESKRITRNGTQISPKSVSNGWGLIEVSLRKVCGKEFDVRLPQLQVEIKEFPDPKEIADAIKRTNSELPCLLAMWLGLRMGEIKGIDCDAIYDGILHIRQTRIYKDGQEIVKPTAKNDTSIRNIEIPSYIMSLIENTEEWKNYRQTGEIRPLITTTRNRIYKRWKRIADDHDWEMSFHDLRAVNASVGLVLGIPDKYMMQRNGYKTDHTLKQRYQSIFTSNRKSADKIIDDYFNSILD